MKDIYHQFHIRWKERRRCVKKFLPTMIYLIICWLSFLTFSTIIFTKNPIPTYVPFNACIMILAIGLWFIVDYVYKIRRANYEDFLKEYRMLVAEIMKDVPKAIDKDYDYLFYDYEAFMKISESKNEFHVLRQLKKIPPGILENPTKQELEIMAREHVTVAMKIQKETTKRNADHAAKELKKH